MSLRLKTLLAIVGSGLVTLCLLLVIAQSLLIKTYEELEAREAAINLERARNALDEQLNFMASKVKDWAAWDDAYQFVQDANQEFATSNISVNTLTNLQIHIHIYVNRQGKVISAIQNLSNENRFEELSPSLPLLYAADSPFLRHATDHDTHQGLIMFPEGPLLVVSMPVVPTTEAKPYAGTLIFAKFLNDEAIAKLSLVTKLPISATPLGEAAADPDTSKIVSSLQNGKNRFLRIIDEQSLVIYSLYQDVYGKPTVLLRVEMPREIMAAGRTTMRMFMVVLLALGLSTSLFTFGLLEFSVIRRIKGLVSGLTGIILKSEDHLRLTADGQDEIRLLSDTANELLSKIEQRNRSLNDIMKNVETGLFICDANMQISGSYSRSCHDLFQTQSLAQKQLPDLFHMSEQDRSVIKLCYQQVFNPHFLPEVALAQIPRQFSLGGRVLSLEGKALYDRSQRVDAVLFAVSDITDQQRIESENLQNRSLIKILKSPHAFAEMLTDTRQLLSLMREHLKKDEDLKLRRILHTLKGNFSVFGLRDLVALIHSLEDKEQLTVQDLDRFDGELASFLKQNRDILRLEWVDENATSYRVEETKVQHLEEEISQLPLHPKQVAKLQFELANLRRRPVHEMIGPLDEFVQGLADRLGKEVKLELEGLDTRMPVEILRPLLDIMQHLLRNALDHGIEAVDERGGKRAEGLVKISFAAQANAYDLFISDDGRGVQVEAVTAKALALGLITKEEAALYDEEKRMHLVLHDKLSTAEKVTDISGRGVGLAAVKALVDDHGGTIRISSRPGQGTSIHISLPEHQTLSHLSPVSPRKAR